MKLKSNVLLFLFGVIITSSGFAQSPLTNMELNRAPLRYFSGVELTELAAEDQVKSNQIKYYFTQSFNVSRTDCKGCEVDFEVFYNFDVFNVVDFESSRENEAEVKISYKNKYQITLKPLNEVVTELGGLYPSQVLTIKLDRPFPQWVSTGDNDADFTLYKTQVEEWAIDFPEHYRTLTSSPDLLKMHFTDFITLRSYRQDEFLTRPGGYLIID